MSVIIIDNALVHYEVIGRGKPVIFLHGWIGSWRYWMPTMEALSDRYRTYAFDLWGFGDSDHDSQRYDLESYVKQLQQFTEQLGLGDSPIALVGHSLGAAVALMYVQRTRVKPQRIMAVSPPIPPQTAIKRLTSGSGPVVNRILGRRGTADYPEVHMEAEKADPNAIGFSARSMSNLELQREMESIEQPVLLVSGDKDPFIPMPTDDMIHSPDGNVRPITLAGARHFPMLDEGPKFQRLLKDFLETEPDDLDSLTLKEEWRRPTR